MSKIKSGDTAKSLIYKDLRRAIGVEHLKSGERLDLEELAQNYETSITPVRDALQMLSQEGLVTIKPRSGYFVSRITLKELRDMLDLREILELAAVELATPRITEEELVQLKKANAGYTDEGDESYIRYMNENKTFHCSIAEASGNYELAKLLESLHNRLLRFLILIRVGDAQERRHARLIDALRTRDVKVAREAMLSELNQTHEAILERVIEDESVFWHLGNEAST